jgi:hypothetical protein
MPRPENGSALPGVPLPTPCADDYQGSGRRDSLSLAGPGRSLFNAVCRLDLEGIVAKRMEDTYRPMTQWYKILNPTYSQKSNRHEPFESRPA